MLGAHAIKVVVIAPAIPDITAWKPQNNHGARNKNVNSIASETPVNELTIAPGITMEAANFRPSPFGAAYNIPNAAPGKANKPNT
jgi:hypothetical protein